IRPFAIARNAATSGRSHPKFRPRPERLSHYRSGDSVSKRVNVAIAGATGAVGEALLSILAEREFPIGELHLLASERSAGEAISFGARQITVKNLAEFDFNDVDIAFFSAGGSVSAEHAPRAAAAGAVVIDNTSE